MTVELYTKFCVDPYPKREFHKKSRVVCFSIAGHICPALVPNSPSADIIVRHYLQCTKGVWHKPNLSILPYFCPYISRFSGRGRWIFMHSRGRCQIVGVAMQKWAWPQNYARVSSSVPHPFLIRLATMMIYTSFTPIHTTEEP